MVSLVLSWTHMVTPDYLQTFWYYTGTEKFSIYFETFFLTLWDFSLRRSLEINDMGVKIIFTFFCWFSYLGAENLFTDFSEFKIWNVFSFIESWNLIYSQRRSVAKIMFRWFLPQIMICQIWLKICLQNIFLLIFFYYYCRF